MNPHDEMRALTCHCGRIACRHHTTADSIVTLNVTAGECKRRARAAGRPEGWDALIDAWWAQHKG